MNNLIIFPGAKTQLYNSPVKINKATINEVINLVYDKISKMTSKQSKNLNQRLKIYEELKKSLPEGKQQKLLQEYSDLYAVETDLILEAAVNYILKNENEISEALVNY